MYTRLTKVIEIDDEQYVTCVYYGTKKCHIHRTRAKNCGQCPMFAAILNQLNELEDILFEEISGEK
jgi:Fe-S-cluster containining protein